LVQLEKENVMTFDSKQSEISLKDEREFLEDSTEHVTDNPEILHQNLGFISLPSPDENDIPANAVVVAVTLEEEETTDESAAEEKAKTWDILLGTLQIINKAVIPTIILVVVAIFGFLGLYIYFEIISLLDTISKYPLWLRCPLIFILAILLCLTLAALVRLSYKFYKLKPNKQSKLSDIDCILIAPAIKFVHDDDVLLK
jgi:hypothetical protein